MKKKVKYTFLIILSLIIIIGAALLYINANNKSNDSTQNQLEHVIFRMDWIPFAEHAPVYLAKDKGFYAEEGLDVEIIHGKGSTLSAQLVASGENDFGICSGDTALMGITKDLPLKILAVIIQKSPTSTTSLKEKMITKPKDLEGKRLGVNVQSTKYNQYKAFSKINNLDTSTITEVPIDPASEIAAVLGDKIDVLLDYTYDGDADFVLRGYEIDKILFEDYGLHIYSASIITNENLFKDNPQLIQRFTRATIKGFEYSLKNPEEAIDIFLKYNPSNDKEIELAKFYNMIPLIETPITKEYGIGYQTKEKWEITQDLLYDLDLIDKKVNVEDIYTNQFLK